MESQNESENLSDPIDREVASEPKDVKFTKVTREVINNRNTRNPESTERMNLNLKQETNNISDLSHVIGVSVNNMNGNAAGVSDMAINNFGCKEKYKKDDYDNYSNFRVINLANSNIKVHTIKDSMFLSKLVNSKTLTIKDVNPETGLKSLFLNIAYYLCRFGKVKIFSNIRSLKILRFDIDIIVALKKLIEFDFLRPFYITECNHSNRVDEQDIKFQKGYFDYEVDLISKRNQKRNLFYVSKIMNFLENQYVSESKLLQQQDFIK